MNKTIQDNYRNKDQDKIRNFNFFTFHFKKQHRENREWNNPQGSGQLNGCCGF